MANDASERSSVQQNRECDERPTETMLPAAADADVALSDEELEAIAGGASTNAVAMESITLSAEGFATGSGNARGAADPDAFDCAELVQWASSRTSG